MTAEEVCSPCFKAWMDAVADRDISAVPTTVPATPPRADGRNVCPECGWLGARRSVSPDGAVETIDLRFP